jgi:hypothetical protein
MAFRKPAPTHKDAPEIAKAVLPAPVNPLAANVNHWVPVPKFQADYEKLCNDMHSEINKTFKESGFSFYLRPLYRFTDNPSGVSYVETITFSLEVSYYSYGKQQTIEFMSLIIDHFKLDTLTARMSHNNNRIEFMFKGTKVVLHNFGPEFRELGCYPENYIISMLNGFEGEFLKVVQHFIRKFGFDVDYMGRTEFILKDEDEEYKRYLVNTSNMETITKLLGASTKNYGSYGYFRSRMEIAQWFMGSKYISKSSFDIDEDNNYVGPADYYGSRLFKELVEIIRTKYADHRHTPESLPETIRKYQMKLWQERNPNTHKAMISDSTNFKELKMIRAKYNDDLITEVTGVTEPEAVGIVKKAFEKHISQKEDFAFFVMSSSDETIREKLTSYRQSFVA